MTSSARSRGARLLRPAADLVRLAGLASLVAMAVRGEWVNAALFSLVLLGLVMPRILALVVTVGPGLDLLYGVVLLFAAWSAVLDLYVNVVSRFGPWRERFFEVAPRMSPAVRRVDADPRLAALWRERFAED